MASFKPTPLSYCPHCGATRKSGTSTCWLCQAVLPSHGADAAPVLATLVPEPRRSAQPGRPFQFGLSSLLLLITFVAILCSIIKMDPGLGIVLTVLAAPAMLRMLIVAFQRQQSGVPMSPSEKAGVFFMTAAMALCVVAAAGAAFCFAFFVTCTATMIGGGGDNTALAVCTIVGGIAAAIVAIFVAFLFWRARRRS
jgi:hypothetical protein